MIECERPLYAVLGLAVFDEEAPGIVHEHIQTLVVGTELFRQTADAVLGREVRQIQLNRLVAGLRPYLFHSRFGLCPVSGYQDDGRTLPGELPGRYLTEAGRGAGNQTDFPLHLKPRLCHYLHALSV